MPYLQSISKRGDRPALEWRNGETTEIEDVVMKSDFAAAEALDLLEKVQPGFRSEALVRKILKTVRTAPRGQPTKRHGRTPHPGERTLQTGDRRSD